MPEELDDKYNEPLREAFRDALRDPDGLKGQLFETLRELYAQFLEVVAQGQGIDDTERRVDEGLQELEAASIEAIRETDDEARRRVEDAHQRGYEAAASAVGVAASELPDWSPDASGTDVNARAPFDGDIEGFVRSSLEEEVSYYKQDLQFIRKYVDEDSYAKATAQVLARGDDEVKQMLARRGIDLDDINTDALLGEAAEVFQNTKTMGSPDIRGILEDINPRDLAARDPQLFQRIKAHGTDRLPRVMDEVAKDLAVRSPAVGAVSWTLSTRHGGLDSSPDECDFLASQDAHGLGPGLYKPTHVPSHPHPNCECSITARTLDPGEWGSDPINTPAAPDVGEESVRAVLEDVRSRIEGGRTVTDRYVETVMKRVNEVTQEVHSNPRG